MTRVEKNAEELRRKDVTMNDFKSKLDDLLDELERCCASQHFEVADDVRAKIHKLMENNIPRWHKLIFIPLTEDEKRAMIMKALVILSKACPSMVKKCL